MTLLGPRSGDYGGRGGNGRGGYWTGIRQNISFSRLSPGARPLALILTQTVMSLPADPFYPPSYRPCSFLLFPLALSPP